MILHLEGNHQVTHLFLQLGHVQSLPVLLIDLPCVFDGIFTWFGSSMPYLCVVLTTRNFTADTMTSLLQST